MVKSKIFGIFALLGIAIVGTFMLVSKTSNVSDPEPPVWPDAFE